MIYQIIIFVTVCILCLSLLSVRRGHRAIIHLEARFLIATVALYCLPLPIAYLIGTSSGDISPYLAQFAAELPSAIFFTTIFVITFTGTYLAISAPKRRRPFRRPTKRKRTKFVLGFTLFLLVSLIMIIMLGAKVGGLPNLILKGYDVTTLLSANGMLAIGFDWLQSLVILLICYGAINGSKPQIKVGILFAALYLLIMIIMGRRGVAASTLIGITYFLVKTGSIKRLRAIAVPAVLAFISLNIVGLTRGQSYSNISDFFTVLAQSTERLSKQGQLSSGLFYTLTNGNFAVPFETLPQLMRPSSANHTLWMGASLFRSLELLIPHALTPSRPMPLANWYMREFYGSGFALNQGRQFFFLSEAYLNFWWFGSVIWGAVLGAGFKIFFGVDQRPSTYWAFALQVLFVGGMLNFVSTATSEYFVAFLKGVGAVPIAMALLDCSRLAKGRSS